MSLKSVDNIFPNQTVGRIQDIDILRGIALFGVILVNVFYFNVPAVYFDSYYAQYHDPINKILLHGLNWFFTGKFYPVFSFLFGLGLSMQYMKFLQRDDDPYPFLKRRLGILLILGFLHIVFVWEEDILFIYAVFGFVLLLFAERPLKFILGAVIVMYFFPIGFKVVIHLAQVNPMTLDDSSSLNSIIRFYTTASYGQILQQRVALYLQKFSRLNTLISELDRLAFILLGFYVGKKKYINTFAEKNDFWFKILLLCLGLFGSGFLVDKLWLRDLDELGNPAALLALKDFLVGITNLFQIFVYIIGFLILLSIPRVRQFFAPLASMGKMAMTGYLMHTLAFSVLFYSYGLRLFGSLAPIQLFMIAIVFYLMLVFLSVFWLNYFQYGPFEWVWRSFTYGKVLPFRKRSD